MVKPENKPRYTVSGGQEWWNMPLIRKQKNEAANRIMWMFQPNYKGEFNAKKVSDILDDVFKSSIEIDSKEEVEQ